MNRTVFIEWLTMIVLFLGVLWLLRSLGWIQT
jgi:hypothetical protein